MSMSMSKVRCETHWRMTGQSGQVVENMRMWDVGCWPQNAMFGKNRLTLGSLSVSRSVLAPLLLLFRCKTKSHLAHTSDGSPGDAACQSFYFCGTSHKKFICHFSEISFDLPRIHFGMFLLFQLGSAKTGLLVRWAQYSDRKVPNMDVEWEFEKKHVCQYCGKNFLQKSAWRDHVKSWHTEDKPYRCCKCNYSSVAATALRTHMQTCKQHEFLCPVRPLCNYSFTSRNALDKHIIMHTGNRSLFKKQWMLM